MDTEAIANALWGGEGSTPAAEPSSGGVQPSISRDEVLVNGIYRENNEGDAPSSYEPVLGSFFDTKEYHARFEKDELQIESLAAARVGVHEVFRAFEVGETGAREILNLFNDYSEHPNSDETNERMAEETARALKKEWGHDYRRMMNSAKSVLHEASKRIPKLMETIDKTGIGNDATFIRRLAYIGKRRGFAK